jgi:hypothetical protein
LGGLLSWAAIMLAETSKTSSTVCFITILSLYSINSV